MNKTLLSLIAAAAVLTSGAAISEAAPKAAANAPAKPAVHATTTKVATVHSEKSKKCSADADAQHLHGKARKAFRRTCLKAA